MAGPARLRGALRLLHLSARLVAGRWFWVVPLLSLLWPALMILLVVTNPNNQGYGPGSLPWLVSLPLAVLATGLGVRIIAAEIDRRTLEIAYTVPGGTARIWLYKIAAAVGILLAAEALLATATAIFLTGFPWWGLYGPFQAAVFYLVLAMALSTFFRSEVTGALVAVPLLFFGFVSQDVKISPFFATVAQSLRPDADFAALLARTVQNHVGYALFVAALIALAFARSERREKMMAG